MSMDRSLRTAGSMSGTRSVLTRAERIGKMQAEKKFDTNKSSPLKLPKTRVGKG
jgi:small basic protein (TIGR04137 family)